MVIKVIRIEVTVVVAIAIIIIIIIIIMAYNSLHLGFRSSKKVQIEGSLTLLHAV
jgi:hypothetical protein